MARRKENIRKHRCKAGGFIAQCWLLKMRKAWCVFRGDKVASRHKSLAKAKSTCSRKA